MIEKLVTEHHMEFLSLKGSYTGSSESTLVKMPHCWKSHVTAQIQMYPSIFLKNTVGLELIPMLLYERVWSQ